MKALLEKFQKGVSPDKPKAALPSFKKKDAWIGIDLSDSTAKTALVTSSAGDIRIENLDSRQFEAEDDTGLSGFIAESVRHMKAGTRRAVCVIPSRHFISRNIDMPSNNEEEIAKIINLQIGRFTPYSRDEIVVDYLCREMEGMHYTNVLLLIVHRKVVERYCRIMEDGGLSIEKIAVASEALAQIYAAAAPECRHLAGLHVGEEATDLTILDGGKMAFVRNLLVGARHFRDNRETAQETFLTELKKSLAAYQDEGIGESVEKLFLTGAVKDPENLKTAILGSFPEGKKQPAVEWLAYESRFEMADSAKQEISSHPEQSYFELMASASQIKEIELDLTPSEVKLRKQVREGGKEVMTLGILIMTLFLMISFYLGAQLYFKSVQIERLDSIHEGTFDRARALERISTKTRAVKKLLENRGRGLYVFDKVTALIGDDIYLTQFAYDAEGNLTLAGTAESMSRIFAFVTQLEESNYFASVKTEETKSRRQGKEEVADFIIQCVLAEGF